MKQTNIEKLIELLEVEYKAISPQGWENAIEKRIIRSVIEKAKSLSQESDWVSVGKELPTESEDVLMTYKGHLGNWHTYTGYVFNGMWHFGEEGENVGDRIITHWQPLPKKPTK